MNRFEIALVALIILSMSSVATARIYKCEGPDGPVYSDRECGPDASHVEVADSAGLSGVSDEVKAELAEKKAGREKEREEARKRGNNRTVINNNYTTVNSEPSGRWLYPGYWGSKPERPRPPIAKPRPRPLPSTMRPRK